MPNGMPYGDIFAVNTPALDRTAAMLYQEQVRKEAKLQQDAQALDQQFARQTTNLRDADVNEYVNRYQKYKQSWMELQKVPSHKQKDYIDKQREVSKNLAEMYSFGNKSISAKQNEILEAKDLLKNPKAYQVNAADIFGYRNSLPITNPDYYKKTEEAKWRLGTSDFSKDIDWAKGQIKPDKLGETDYTNLPGGLERQKSIYKGYNNTAPVFAKNLLGRVVGSQKTHDFVSENPQLDPTDPNNQAYLQQIDVAYDNMINRPDYKTIYKGKELEFPQWMRDTPQGQVAMYMAKNWAINSKPTIELQKPETIEAAKMDKAADIALKRQRSMAYLQNALITGRIDHKHNLDVEDMLASDDNFQQSFEKAGTGLPVSVVKEVFGTPKDENGHELPAPIIELTPDKSRYRFIIYTDGKEDPNHTKELPVSTVREEARKQYYQKRKAQTGGKTGTTKPRPY